MFIISRISNTIRKFLTQSVLCLLQSLRYKLGGKKILALRLIPYYHLKLRQEDTRLFPDSVLIQILVRAREFMHVKNILFN